MPRSHTAYGHGGIPFDFRSNSRQCRDSDVGSSAPSTRRPVPPTIGTLTDSAKTEVLAFTGFPQAHWHRVWSTNPLERIRKGIKRRSLVVGIFPNEAALIRLVRAVLADIHDE